MELHGNDIGIQTSLSKEEIISIIRKFWPQLSVEHDDDSVFVYKNKLAQKSWDARGWTEQNDTEMIHVMFGSEDGKVWFVIDDKKQNERIIKEIERKSLPN